MIEPSSNLEALLKLAGERDQPSAEGVERARAAARLSWQRALDRAAAKPARARRRWMYALAAGLAALSTAVFWLRPPPTPPVTVAHMVKGEARVATRLLSAGAPLHAGDELSTGGERAALGVGDALSLRLDRHTRLRFEGMGHVTLLAGAVYVDSGGLNATAALRIDTPAGVVRHVGTQFQVHVRDGLTRVLVREGRVVLTAAGGAALDLGAGDLAEVGRGRLDLQRGQPSSGADWEWAADVAPTFDIENRPLSEFLAWLAREQGWQLRYADGAVQSRAQEIRLHGSLSNLDAAAMLERASLVTGVPLTVREGSLWVGPP